MNERPWAKCVLLRSAGSLWFSGLAVHRGGHEALPPVGDVDGILRQPQVVWQDTGEDVAEGLGRFLSRWVK